MGWMSRMALAACVLAAATGTAAPAEERGPVKLVVGFVAGGTPDLVARKIAARLAEQLGRSVTVENRPGGSGTIAAAAVAKAPPDGNTLMFGVAANLAVTPASMRTAPYDPVRDFSPIIEVARGPYVLLVRSDAPARNFAEFLTWVRSQPGKLNYASPGSGSVHHVAMEMVKAGRSLHLVHIPYRSGLYQPLLAGDVHVMFETLPAPLPFLDAGKLRVLAVTGPRRLARLPDVPTLAELGVREVDDISSWWGFVGPAGMPKAMVDKYNAELRRAMADPDVQSTMKAWGIELTPGTPEEFGRLIAQENVRWKQRVKDMGLPVE
jgi:tripartite-type tricarboxylate transporter receptor subunit TctC